MQGVWDFRCDELSRGSQKLVIRFAIQQQHDKRKMLMLLIWGTNTVRKPLEVNYKVSKLKVLMPREQSNPSIIKFVTYFPKNHHLHSSP